MSRDRLLAFAQLLRIPNAFTAFADIALGGCVAAAVLPAAPAAFWAAYLLLALASFNRFCQATAPVLGLRDVAAKLLRRYTEAGRI